jgi:hypothetical protein
MSLKLFALWERIIGQAGSVRNDGAGRSGGKDRRGTDPTESGLLSAGAVEQQPEVVRWAVEPLFAGAVGKELPGNARRSAEPSLHLIGVRSQGRSIRRRGRIIGADRAARDGGTAGREQAETEEQPDSHGGHGEPPSSSSCIRMIGGGWLVEKGEATKLVRSGRNDYAEEGWEEAGRGKEKP